MGVTVDQQNLFVTGGSGGGTLSAWIIGKTDRFRAAVVVKPVINWYSFALTADAYNFFYRDWFSGFPWAEPEQYLGRSPISRVGNVTAVTRPPAYSIDQTCDSGRSRAMDRYGTMRCDRSGLGWPD